LGKLADGAHGLVPSTRDGALFAVRACPDRSWKCWPTNGSVSTKRASWGTRL